jgi:spore coat polysaccharide biosynthesis protein SpsF (cytidylyltransferase family)
VKAGILLSVREKASRFPGKVLKPLGDGNVTEFLIDRLRQSRRAARVVLATSDDPRDGILAQIAARRGIDAFRGSADDKLRRYRDACRAFDLEFAVVVDGDDPFVSVEHIDRLIAYEEESPVDYVVFDNLPLGATGFGLAATGLEKVCDNRAESDTEVWGKLFFDDPRFVCKALREQDSLYAHPEIRMTLDYESDYRFFLAVIDGLKARRAPSTFHEIMRYLAAHPEVIEINRDAQPAYEAHLRALSAATARGGSA